MSSKRTALTYSAIYNIALSGTLLTGRAEEPQKTLELPRYNKTVAKKHKFNKKAIFKVKKQTSCSRKTIKSIALN